MFSVVIPIFNHSAYLRAGVESALASPLVREILLVDDGSADDSAAIARALTRSFPGRVRDLSDAQPVNQGAHVRLNQLCQAATQTWIAILNSDDLCTPGRFETAELVARTTGCDFISGAILIIDEAGTVIGTKRGIQQPEYPSRLTERFPGLLDTADLRLVLCNQNIIATTSNMMFRRELFRRTEGFADLRYSHDWEFALRATMLGRSLWTPNFLTTYRVHRTNTIKELTPHVNGEIARFFYRFLDDNPVLEADAEIRAALETNAHLQPYVPAPVRPVRPEPGAGVLKSAAMSRRATLNALLCLSQFNYDYVLVSHGLEEAPLATAPQLVQLGDILDVPVERLPVSTRGRFIRVPGSRSDARSPEHWSCCRTLPNDVAREGQDIVSGWPDVLQTSVDLRAASALAALVAPSDHRRRCLVLPIFMAVGGVERNTIEMMRELREEYVFTVITTERLRPEQGTLHHQLDEIGVDCFDLGEIAGQSHHLQLLATLNDWIRPDLVWICNGSPWLLENALRLRRLFADIPIVDQQVYDTKMGWIESYDRIGIQSFDHFIAIHGKIEQHFLRSLRIPRHRVSLIYSAINSSRISAARLDGEARATSRSERGLPAAETPVFAFIGRLTIQKRPLDFLDLARRSQLSGKPDRFLLIGDGELRGDCDRFIESNRLSNVVVQAYCPFTPDLLACIDGLVITSAFEGIPIVVLESLGVGTPVFATDVGDIAALLSRTGVGCVCPVDAGLDVLWKSFEDWKLRRADYASQALLHRDAVTTDFGSRVVAGQYRKVFSALTSAPEPRTRP